MLIALAAILVVAWLLAKFVWHVASFGIHLALVVAAIAVIAHFVRARGLGGRGGTLTT
ncbi:MAG TPA: DUF5670 family protein [Kofleriaceae bacterium]|nr:DUF5670 family protein [Kofleriaceae bacterium]